MKLLDGKDTLVYRTDSHGPVFRPNREQGLDTENIDPIAEAINRSDPLIFAPDHTKFDYPMFKQNAQLILDMCRVYLSIRKRR